MSNKLFQTRSQKEAFKGALSVCKSNGFTNVLWYLLFFVLLGCLFVGFSFVPDEFSFLPYIAVFSCFFLMVLNITVFVKYHFQSKKKVFKLGEIIPAYLHGGLHIIMSILKAFLAYITVSFLIVIVTFAVDKNLFNDIQKFVQTMTDLSSESVIEADIANRVLNYLKFTECFMLGMGSMVFLYSIRRNEQSNNFGQAMINDRESYYVYPSFKTKIFKSVHKLISKEHMCEAWLIDVVAFVLFIGGFVGGCFIGFALPNSICQSPALFGLGLGLALYGLTAGLERSFDISFFCYHRIDILVSLNNGSEYGSVLTQMQAAFREIFDDNGNIKFDTSNSEYSFGFVDPEEERKNGEAMLKRQFMYRKNPDFKEIEIQEVSSSEDEVAEEMFNEDNMGLFSLDEDEREDKDGQ